MSMDTPYGLGGTLHGGNDIPPMQPPKAKSVANPTNNDQCRAVLDMVNGTPGTDADGNVTFTGSTMATVLKNNEFPALSGFSIPANLGQVIQMAPNPLPDTPTAGVTYVNNPVLKDGGSWVTVNVKTREIISIDTGTSTSAPVDYSGLFQYIKHDGADNPKGFKDPPPIGQPQTSKMPQIVKQTGPIIDNATVPEPDGIDGSVYDLLFTIVLDIHQADYDPDKDNGWGDGIAPDWFQGLKFYRRLSGHTDVVEVADMGFQGDLTWTQAVEVGANNTYDLGVAFLDLSNRVSAIAWPNGSSHLFMPPLGGQNVGGLANKNLLSDSEFSHPSNLKGQPSNWQQPGVHGWPATCGHMEYWSDFNVENQTAFYAKGGNNGSNFWAVEENNNDGVLRWIGSEAVEVASGFTYTASCYIDSTQLGAASPVPNLEIYDLTGHPNDRWGVDIVGTCTLLASVGQQAGSSGRVQMQWTNNNPAVTLVAIVLNNRKSFDNFLPFAQPQFEYGSVMTAYKPTTGLTHYGRPSQGQGSKPPTDVEVTMTNRQFSKYDKNHFTYGCMLDFDITIDPDSSRWLDRATIVYCEKGTYDPDNVSGYPQCGSIAASDFPVGPTKVHITTKLHGFPNGEAWDVFLCLYDGTGEPRFKQHDGAWTLGTTTKQGKQSQPALDPTPVGSSISVGSYNNDGSTYGGTLTLTLAAGLDPADWCNGAKVFYVPTGGAFDPNALTGYPTCAHLPQGAIVLGSPISIPFHGLACGQQFDLYLVLTDVHGQHHIVSGGTSGSPVYGSAGNYGGGSDYGPSLVIATTTNQVISKGGVIGSIIARPHMKGSTSSDYTTAIVDGSNNLIHGIMSASAQAVLGSSPGGDGLYLNSAQIKDRHISSVQLDTISDGTTYARAKASHLASGVPYNFQGVWSGSSVSYLKGDEVIYGPSYWLCLVANTSTSGTFPSLSNANWQVVGSYSGFDGAWSSSTAYPAGAEVTYLGNYYVCIVANTNQTPSPGSSYWQIAGPTSLDAIADGTSFKRIAAAESTSGIVTRIGDGGGTNFRTYTHISGAIDTSSRIIGNIYDGANSRSPANITTALDGSGRIIGSLYDGTNTRTPANVATAIDASGRHIGTLYDGTNSRSMANITTALDASGRVIGSIYNGTTALTPTTLLGTIDGSGNLDVTKVQSGKLLPYTNLTATVTGTIDSSGNLDFTKAQSGKLLPYGNVSATITGTIDSSGNLDFTKAQSGKLLPYGNHAAVVTGVIDSSGNILNNPWGNASGVVETANGEYTGFATTGTPTHAQYITSVTGKVLNIDAHIKNATSGTDLGLILGTQTLGYAIKWNGTTGSVDLGYYSSGSFTSIHTLGTISPDTNWHALQISVKNNGANNTIEASFDALPSGLQTDSHVLMSGSKPATVFAVSTALVTNFDVEGALPLFSEMHSSLQTAVDPTTGYIISGIFDSGSGVTLLPNHLTDVIGIFSGHGRVNVNPAGGVVGIMPLANHAAEVTNVIKSVSGVGKFDATTAQSGTLLPYGNLSATITGTIDGSGNVDFTKAQSGKLVPFGNMPAAVSGAINSNSSLNNVPFSGCTMTTLGYITGFASGGSSSTVAYEMDSSTFFVVEADIQSGGSGDSELIIGNTSNGYGIRWDAGTGSIKIYKYSGGSGSPIVTLTGTFPLDANLHSFRLAVRPGVVQSTIEGAFDNASMTQYADLSSPIFPNGHVTIKAGGTSGTVSGFLVHSNELYSAMAPEFSSVIGQTLDGSGSFIIPDVIYAQHINGVTGTGNLTLAKIGVGSFTLDNVPDGTTNGLVLKTCLTSNQVDLAKTGVQGRVLSNIADDASYKKVVAADVNSSNHIQRIYNTPFNNTGVFIDTDGSIGGFPGSGTQVATNAAYPIVAAFPLTAAGWFQLGSTGTNAFMLIGNQTNGIGFRWNTSGVVALAVYKAGTGTFTTIATVTNDTKLHWFSIKLTPGTTPGSTDAYVIFFDKNTLAGSTGTTAITWGTTANVNFAGGNANAALHNFRVSSQNP